MVIIDTAKRANLSTLSVFSEKENTIPCRADGLSKAEVLSSEKKYGKNIIKRKKRDSFFLSLLKSFNDPIIKILIGALIINALASLGRINWAESIGIIAAILIATVVSTVSEYTSARACDRLSEGAAKGKCTLRRGGRILTVSPSEIVVGDRIILTQGMKIPCDGVLVCGTLSCDQSPLTGESREVQKYGKSISLINPENTEFDLSSEWQVFGGSTVLRGEGEMIALRVGESTFMGEIAVSLSEKSRQSPLKHRLSSLAKTIGFLGYIGAFMIAVAYLFNSFFIDSGMDMVLVRERLSDTPFLISEILRAVTVAVSVVVVAVPEGLPMMITVVLSSNMKKMMKGGVLVRRLTGIETAGNLNILFTDKTGTLTTGKMKAVYSVGADWTEDISKSKTLSNQNIISECIGASCSPYGSATEKALFALCKKSVTTTKRIPFDSKRKYSEGLTKDGISYFAGAPEALLPFCQRALDKNGKALRINSFTIGEIKKKQEDMSKKACRMLCLAAGDGDCLTDPQDLTFIALIAIRDPVRKDVPASVKDCAAAGIQVVMVTGDNPDTARAVAAEAGILTKERNRILKATELHSMSDSEVLASLPDIAVVSRALPSDKIRLVRISEEAGMVVGMTGDGINDAPALKAADVGFAMGSGTDIAKDAGDIVITDDSFSSITRAVLYGRTIFHSIRKFISFQLLMNLFAMGISLLGPFMGIDSPVTVIQMLWVNIIMDTLGGLAFAGEPAMRKYMLSKSPPRDAKLLSKRMLSQIVITGGYTLFLGIFFLKSPYIRSLFSGDDTYFLTAFFAVLIFCGIFNSFNVRTQSINIFSNISKNKPFIFIMTLVAAVQLLIIYFGGEIFRCAPLSARDLLHCALISVTVIPADMLRKLLFLRKKS